MSRILDERDKRSIENKINQNVENINQDIDDLETYVNEKDADINSVINNHKADTNNPHKVTYEQAGADPKGSAAQALVDAKAYTDTAVSNLVDSAPETLNTLNELAASLGDDKNFAATMTTELGKKTNNTDFEVHTSNVSNPHSVSKSQVGLGNVPNVATNDQTPTYTEATTLATLASGEKLSVSFGKIMKAITDLISHIGNKSNPHTVTKDQVGLGNCNNTSDMDKPVSTAQAKAISDADAQVLLDAKSYADGEVSSLSIIVDNKVDKDGDKVLTDNNLTDTLKDNYDTAYNHSISDHAPIDAEKNVQSNWTEDDDTSDAYIQNKPALGSMALKDVVENDDLSEDIKASLALADTSLQSYEETDPTVPEWAKQPEKPAYTASEVGALPDTTYIPELPAITEVDEGKVLCIVNGAFALVSISDLLSGGTETPDEPEVPVEPEEPVIPEEPEEPEV